MVISLDVAMLVLCLSLLISSSIAQSSTLSLVKLQNAAELNAVCNDGSPGAYYFQAGNPNKWVIHLMGGAWCADQSNCAQRFQTQPYLMSSKLYPNQYQFAGIFDRNSTKNRGFFDATFVYMMYCSSDSFSGTRAASDQTFGWNFQGKNILTAAIKQLLPQGLANASEVLLSGCSAGGAAVFANADYVASLLPPIKRTYKAHSDAGWFLDFPAFIPQPYTIPEILEVGQSLWGGVTDQDCMASLGVNSWKCYLGQYAMSYIETPTLVHQESEDRPQLVAEGISPYPLTQDMQDYINRFRKNLTSTFQSELPPHHAVFSPACWFHCIVEYEQFYTISINGINDQQALDSFYFGGKVFELIDGCAGFNCSTGCPPIPPKQIKSYESTFFT